MIDKPLFVTQAKGRQGTGQGSLLCSKKVQDGASQTGMFLLIYFLITLIRMLQFWSHMIFTG